ncbi:MAG TPA: hypothetical protein VEY67_01950, partial [Candidatus Dormibacteraeota bacterium]|nr:hypothetical protein [Candidatus Dormibacteraeota bacterium]
MNERLELSDAAIETMLVRRARRADPGDLADVALDAVRRTRARSARPWDGLARWPRLDTGSPRWVWIAVAAMLAIALVGGLLAAGASRLHQRQYPIVTSGPELNWLSRQGAVSADELWTVAAGESPSRDGGSVAGMAASPGTVLWHYIGGTWQSPISPPPLGDEAVGDLELAP